MARKISMAALFVVLAATLLQSTFATNYTVGNSTGWRIPTGTEFYDDWKENKSFSVGDILVFNFATGQHDVAQVNKTAYDACSGTNAISTWTNGPHSITLTSTGEHYFICTFSTHCSVGQRLEVDVGNGNSTTPTPGSSPNTNTTTGVSTPPSSASSLVATLSLVFISIVLVLLCY